jgi:hypothetical protein
VLEAVVGALDELAAPAALVPGLEAGAATEDAGRVMGVDDATVGVAGGWALACFEQPLTVSTRTAHSPAPAMRPWRWPIHAPVVVGFTSSLLARPAGNDPEGSKSHQSQ